MQSPSTDPSTESYYRPNRDEAVARMHSGGATPIYRELTSDGLTPVSAFAKIAQSTPAFLFESVIGGEKVGRYSFLGSQPFLEFLARGRTIQIQSNEGDTGVSAREYESDDPIDELRQLIRRYSSSHALGLPRFCGGAVGFAAYDSVRYFERLPNAPLDDRGLPDLAFAFYDQMVIFDHIRKTILVIAQARPHEPTTEAAHQGFDRALSKINGLVDQLSRPGPDLRPIDIGTEPVETNRPASNMTEDGFKAIVERCREYIKAGDIFQVVPSQRFRVETSASAFDIYRTLRVVNPSPFLFYLPFKDFALVGSSPEVLVRVEDREVTIRPLAGTRPRGQSEAEDRALAEELLADPKERAEHVMLIDLGRNDVGRVADRSTVRLTEVMTVERYSHVMHISSNVVGELAQGLDCFDALRAGLPAGTVSGAPKIRAMEIIDELEPTRRGPYGGAVGYIDYTGNMDTCIALRTLVLQGQTADIQAGAGIVYDSDPLSEYTETVNKARGLLKAIRLAEQRFSSRRTRHD